MSFNKKFIEMNIYNDWNRNIFKKINFIFTL